MLRHYVLIAIFALGLTTTTYEQATNEPLGKRSAVIISKIDAAATGICRRSSCVATALLLSLCINLASSLHE